MSQLSTLPEPVREELSQLRGTWWAYVILGVINFVLGLALIGSPWIGTFAAVWILSILLMTGGVVQFVGSFWCRGWGGFFLSLLMGVFYVATGVIIFDRPVEAAAILTLVVAVLLIAGGLIRILGAVIERFAAWPWVLLGGVLSLILGIMIWRQFPASAFWVIGLFLGLELFFSGLTWIMLGLSLRSLPSSGDPAEEGDASGSPNPQLAV